MENRQKRPLKLFLIRLMQGALIGLGAGVCESFSVNKY